MEPNLGVGGMVVVENTWAEQLVARGIAPVKAEFRLPPPSTRNCESNKKEEIDGDVKVEVQSSVVVKEKKSKRQLKRERKQEKNPALVLCPEVRKTGTVDSCSYSSECHFSHDLEAFLAQKLEDLDGECPYAADSELCPYGLTCRFGGTHKESAKASNVNSEVNGLSKDVQRLLWKNKLKLPKSESVLKSLGLAGKFKPNKDDAEEDDGAKEVAPDEVPPLKKSKPSEEADTIVKTHPREKKIIDFRGKTYLAPLTTVGNLPFRRVCKAFGADVTCGEMAMCTNLLQGKASEWALLRRHSDEDLFGVQICGSYPDTIARAVELIDKECSVDFIDVNMGCPIDIVVNKGAGSCLLTKPMRMKSIIQAASYTVDTPVTLKVRTGYFEGKNRIDTIIADMGTWGANALTIHGRTRQQRYSKTADWEYINKCVENAPETLHVIGNGDVFSYVDWNKRMSSCPKLSTCMVARGGIIKPWVFTEIKEQRHWDISSGERLDMLKDYVRYGLHHWGSDTKGVETTRRFVLEWLSYLCRYVPVGLLEVVPQQLNWRPPAYYGRNDLETLMASDSAADWVRISEMLLGKVPHGFTFTPKHKSNAYDKAENG